MLLSKVRQLEASGQPPISALLEDVLASYYHGLAQPVKVPLKINQTNFQQYLQNELRNRLPKSDYLVLNQYSVLREHGLQAARQGNLVQAIIDLEQAQQPLLQTTFLSPAAILLAQSFQETDKAYLDTCQSYFGLARSRLFKSLATNATLQHKYNCASLQLTSLSIAHKLLRIYICQGDYQQALSLGLSLLDYIEGQSDHLPIPGAWSRPLVMAQPAVLLEGLFGQIVIELSQLLSGPRPLIKLSRSDLLAHSAQCVIYPQAHAWLGAKQAQAAHKPKLFLEEIGRGLHYGRQEPFVIWYALLVEVVIFCRQNPSIGASELERTFVKNLAVWPRLPTGWLNW